MQSTRLLALCVGVAAAALAVPGVARSQSVPSPDTAPKVEAGIEGTAEQDYQPWSDKVEPTDGSRSAEDYAAELANPNTVLGTLNFNLDYVSYGGDISGAGQQSGLRLVFQPSLPYPIGKGVNVFLRPAIPLVIRQDVPVSGGGFDDTGFNLGDMSFDAAIGKTFPSGVILFGGIVGTLPTATDDALGKDQWALGPEVAIAWAGQPGVAGVLVTHQWDVAGEDSYKTNVTAGQYFYTINLRDGWQIGSGPTFAYDHEASSGQRWTFPVGIGVKKTAILKGRPWKFGFEYWYFASQPDAFGPDWQVRFAVAPVVALPWGN